MTAATSSRPGVSPSSSPRLPSPPPFTEVQFGPKSPSFGGNITELQLEEASKQDDGALRRVRPGSRATDIAKGPPFVPLHELESPFQLQEYLKALYHKLTRDEDSNTVNPITKASAIELATPPKTSDTEESVDRNLWLYELCRLLCSKTTRLIVAFFAESPPCSSQTCPEMRASEWQYLCAVHEPPKSCCAIDYCNHTLDWASNVLTSTKHFPSRLSLGGEGGNAVQGMRQLTNIFRRVYRIYAHAWFQHREVFWAIEAELGLYMLFKTVCDTYQLIPEDNYTIPPEAEGERDSEIQTPISMPSPQRMHVLQREPAQAGPSGSEPPAVATSVSTGATTRRHKHTPSTGAPVAVIAEGVEEEEESGQSAVTENTTILQTTSPAKMTESERKAPPRHIDLPENEARERAPEDPTPTALYDVNPLSSSIPVRSNTTRLVSHGVIATSDPLQSTSETQDGPGDAIFLSPETHYAEIAQDSSAIDNDAEAPGEAKDSDDQEGDDVGNETMERIEISDPANAAADASGEHRLKENILETTPDTTMESTSSAVITSAAGQDDITSDSSLADENDKAANT